jgi:hypothetical protein
MRRTLPARVNVGWRFEIALYDALRSIGVPADKTLAVITALEQEFKSRTVTHHTPPPVDQQVMLFGQQLKHELDRFESSLTMRWVLMLAVATTLFYAAMKLT